MTWAYVALDIPTFSGLKRFHVSNFLGESLRTPNLSPRILTWWMNAENFEIFWISFWCSKSQLHDEFWWIGHVQLAVRFSLWKHFTSPKDIASGSEKVLTQDAVAWRRSYSPLVTKPLDIFLDFFCTKHRDLSKMSKPKFEERPNRSLV